MERPEWCEKHLASLKIKHFLIRCFGFCHFLSWINITWALLLQILYATSSLLIVFPNTQISFIFVSLNILFQVLYKKISHKNIRLSFTTLTNAFWNNFSSLLLIPFLVTKNTISVKFIWLLWQCIDMIVDQLVSRPSIFIETRHSIITFVQTKNSKFCRQ